MKTLIIIIFYIFFNIKGALADETMPSVNDFPILVISCSLSPASKSALVAKNAYDFLKCKGYNVSFLDLRDYNLPIANGHDQSAYADSQVKEIHNRILEAKGIIIASPIYNYSVAATSKNLLELTSHPYKDVLSGKAWMNKVIGFIGASGSPRSMLAFLPFLNSLMLDAKAIIVPEFVITSPEDFKETKSGQEITQKVEKLAAEVCRITQALLQAASNNSVKLLN